ncbi:MAG: RICIN domain-containing protein, partial [Lachnospiraceae bacterium]|nr:RICIN domain-containing protein [Lachnospiraceae bacterium]
SSEDGANIQIWSNNGQSPQNFGISPVEDGYAITTECTGHRSCVDVKGAKKTSGTNDANGYPDQLMELVNTGDGCFVGDAGSYISADISTGLKLPVLHGGLRQTTDMRQGALRMRKTGLRLTPGRSQRRSCMR